MLSTVPAAEASRCVLPYAPASVGASRLQRSGPRLPTRHRPLQLSSRVLVQASHSTPGQQVLDRLQSVSPVQLDGEVVVLSFMFVFPAVLFLAGRILIWDYKNRPSVPERQTSEGPEQQSLSSSGSAYRWASERDTKQPKSSQRAIWASALVERSVWLTSARARWGAAQGACTASECTSFALTWCWVSWLLALQQDKQPRTGRTARNPVLADLAEQTMRETIPWSVKEARRLSEAPN